MKKKLFMLAIALFMFIPFINVHAAGEKVSNLHWEGTEAKWNEYDGATGYKEILLKCTNPTCSSTTTIFDSETPYFYQNLSSFFKANNTYIFKVAPMFGSSSNVGDFQQLQRTIGEVTNVSIDSNTYEASWNKYNGASGYIVWVMKEGSPDSYSQVGSSRVVGSGDTTTLDLSRFIYEYGSGKYKISINAFVDSSGNTIAMGESPSSTITLDTNPRTVTIQVEGNGIVDANKTSGFIGEQIILTANANAGYEFARFELISGNIYNFNHEITYGVSPFDFNLGEDNVVIKAVFNRISHTVTFNTNGGSSVASKLIYDGDKVTRPTTDPTKNGYTFDDWYTDDTYATKFDFANTTITADTTIYAKFNQNQSDDNNTTGDDTNTNTNTNTNNNATTTGTTTNDSSNPQTGDNVMFYISMLGLSIIGLAGVGLYIRKRRFN